MNFYCGCDEYLIMFSCGKHYIINTHDYEVGSGMDGVIFSGTIEACFAKRDRMIIEYKESLL